MMDWQVVGDFMDLIARTVAIIFVSIAAYARCKERDEEAKWFLLCGIFLAALS
jgi:hypothetical protein